MSVAIGTYNGAEYLGAQLDSIMQQTCAPDEIVICDDASGDVTPALLEAYARCDPARIKLHLYSQNVGFIRNFERAIAACSGDLIVLSDQDDVWLPTRLAAIQAAFAAHPDSDLVFTNARLVDENLNSLDRCVYSKQKAAELAPEATIGQFVRALQIKGCTLAFRRRHLQWLLPFWPEHWGHDHWIAALLITVSQAQFIDEPLLLHRRHIEKIRMALEAGGMALVPLRMYFKGALVKVEVGLATGKKQYDRRDDLKKRAEMREVDQAMKQRRG